MKNSEFTILLLLVVMVFACQEEKDPEISPFSIAGLNLDNYPKMDCSTSAEPLQTLIACKLLNYNYEWFQKLHCDATYTIYPDFNQVEDRQIYEEKLNVSGTNKAYMNLINKNADLILVARTASADELKQAKTLGIELIETPIALDAFIFIVNKANRVESLTPEEIQDIYMGNITNWQKLGGGSQAINPYLRDTNSGSQELMDELVMKNMDYADWPIEALTGMMGPFERLQTDEQGICYTVYYFKEFIVRESNTKSIAINNIYPDKNTLKNKSYPYVTDVYAVIRKDLDKTSMAYKLYDLLQKGSGNGVIEESGYIPYN